MKARRLRTVTGVRKEDLAHLPAYVRKPVMEAAIKIRQLQLTHVLLPGLYYLVLIDLCDSTRDSAFLLPDVNRDKIEQFVRFTGEALASAKTRGYAHFLKEAGDAAFLVFALFKDIVAWADQVDRLLARHNRWVDSRRLSDHYKTTF